MNKDAKAVSKNSLSGNIPQDKPSLRDIYKVQSTNISNYLHRSEKVCNILMAHPKVQEADSVILYYPMIHEVDIKPLAYYFWKRGKEVYLPFTKKIALGKLSNWENTQKNGLRIPDPIEEDLEANPSLAILPGLAFDKQNYRLGFGFGWYDRYLTEYRKPYKIGVCFEEQFVDELPHEEHDVKMDEVIVG